MGVSADWFESIAGSSRRYTDQIGTESYLHPPEVSDAFIPAFNGVEWTTVCSNSNPFGRDPFIQKVL